MPLDVVQTLSIHNISRKEFDQVVAKERKSFISSNSQPYWVKQVEFGNLSLTLFTWEPPVAEVVESEHERRGGETVEIGGGSGV